MSLTVWVKASQDTIDKVNRSLPVKINDKDVAKTPEFVKLLKVLSQHLNEEGISKPVKHDLAEAEMSLQQEKRFWLHHHILHEALGELLLDHQLSLAEGTATSVEQQFYSIVHDYLMTAEIRNFLSPNLDTQATLLGLKAENLARSNPHVKHLPAIQQTLIPDLENHLRKKCETIVNFHESSPKTESSKLTFAKAANLPEILEAEKQVLEEYKCQLRQSRARREKQFSQYYRALVSSYKVLEAMVMKHRLELQAQCDATTSEWLTSRCDAMCLKIKLLELQLMCDTYTVDAVHALNIIKKEVVGATDTVNNNISAVSQVLKSYESVGNGFDALVMEYTYLKEEIENKKWALHELK